LIENNVVMFQPAAHVTPFGTNLTGIAEYGTSARLDAVPCDDTVLFGDIPRAFELSNDPTNSPGIGQGQATDLTNDLLGRVYTSPPDVGCFQSDPGTAVSPVPRAPYVLATVPVADAVDASAVDDILITLLPVAGTTIDPATVDDSTVTLLDPAHNTIPSTVSLDEGTGVITLNHEGRLYPYVVYTVILSDDVADTDGNKLASSFTFNFQVVGPAEPAVYLVGPVAGWNVGALA
jgi:hypothetical protein